MIELNSDLTESFPRLLREKSLEEIEARSLTRVELADKLNLFPAGIDRIMHQKTWPASLGLRVLKALEVSVEVRFPDQPEA